MQDVMTPGRVASVRPSRFSVGAISFLVGAAGGAVAVWIGVQGELGRIETERDQAVQATTSLRDDLTTVRSREALLRARVAATEALREIDARNFGLAQEQLTYAAMALATVDPQHVAEVDAKTVASLQHDLEAARTEVAPDTAAYRQTVSDLVTRLRVAAGR